MITYSKIADVGALQGFSAPVEDRELKKLGGNEIGAQLTLDGDLWIIVAQVGLPCCGYGGLVALASKVGAFTTEWRGVQCPNGCDNGKSYCFRWENNEFQ